MRPTLARITSVKQCRCFSDSATSVAVYMPTPCYAYHVSAGLGSSCACQKSHACSHSLLRKLCHLFLLKSLFLFHIGSGASVFLLPRALGANTCPAGLNSTYIEQTLFRFVVNLNIILSSHSSIAYCNDIGRRVSHILLNYDISQNLESVVIYSILVVT